MKLDKIKFANIVAFIAGRFAVQMDAADIEHLDKLLDIDIHEDIREPPATVIRAVKPSDIDALLDAMFGDSMIEAIKRYRHLTGLPLKDAKAAIEAVIEKYWMRGSLS